MKQTSYCLLLALTVACGAADANEEEKNRDLLKSITEEDLIATCPSRYLEIHLSASSSDEAGLAIWKLFWLVDSDFVKELVDGSVNGHEVGKALGDAFRRYCEQKPAVTVDVAVKQSIVYLKYKSENPN